MGSAYVGAVWYPIAPFYYVGHALEGGRGFMFIVVAAIITGLLAWKRPRGWVIWSILTAVVALILAVVSGHRDRPY